MRTFVANLLPKLRRRCPRAWAESDRWLHWQDSLLAAHHLSAGRRRELSAALQRCQRPTDYFAFAKRVFPSHQIEKEILGFLDFARGERPQTVVEIGTAQGGTNFLMGALLPDTTLQIGVDLFVQNSRLLQAFGRPACRRIYLNGSSYAPATVERVRATLGSRSIDLLFIDGDHSHAGVKADFEAYAPFVRKGGLVAFHDIEPDYKTRYSRDTGRYAGEVPQYWREVKAQFAQTWEFIDTPGQDGLGIGVGRIG